jgi:septum formation protein
MKIILGSESKWRKMMLEDMGIKFKVMPANIDEKAIRINDPKELTLSLARAKAAALKTQITGPAILITSDQVVVCDGVILEKPETAEQAKSFLRGYNHSPAEVVTAVVVTNLSTGKTAETVDTSTVFFYLFTEQIIEDLIKDPDVYALCGAFKVSEGFKKQIQRIEGKRDSVIGLPKDATLELIKEVS